VTSSAPPRGKTMRAASAAGSCDAAITGIGSTRSMAILMITYMAATSSVPPMMARGSVTVGCVLSSAM
jgi:DNA-binding transcriptional regulator LsrR (DeoR family)